MDGIPVVVAKDVATALGYKWHRGLMHHVPEKWRGVIPIDSPSGIQEMQVLTEEGLNFFSFRSDKPSAQPFQEWIAGDLLPAIRKNGVYISPAAANLPVAQLAEQVARATGLQAPETWKQDLAHKIEQTRGCSKGGYENTKKILEGQEQILAAMGNIKARPMAILEGMKPAQFAQALNALSRISANKHDAQEAASRLFPGLIPKPAPAANVHPQPEQPSLPGLEGAA